MAGGRWWLHGMGMFCEAYVLFSVGNLGGLFGAAYPDCYKSHLTCSSGLIGSITYSEVGGVIFGMLTMGYIADKFGRRTGSRITSAVMLLGSILLACASGPSISGQFAMFTFSLGLYGYGVGGEYPLASASAVERSESSQSTASASGHTPERGKAVVLTFSMQGVGNFTQTLVMVILMAAFQQTGLSAVLSPHRLEIVWRLQYAFIALVLLILTFYRILRLQESEVWKTAAPLQHVPGSPSPQPQLSDAAAVGQPTHAHGDSANTSNRKDCIQTEATTGFGSGAPLDDSFNMSPSNRSGTGQEHDAGRASSPNSSPPLIKTPSNSVWKLVFVFLRTNWHRLIGTSIGWFVWDIAFYGNKLFQGRFISAIYGHPSPYVVLKWTLLNSGVALVGYYVAAFTIDKPWMGRFRMQLMGFSVCTLAFGACGIWYHTLTETRYLQLFQVLYYTSTFFGQWGPNATTWLLPSELFPTEVRAVAHGISAAAGKAGALAAGFVFSHLSTSAIFFVSAACGLIGALVTWLFVPDVTTLDIKELDKRWNSLRAGGPAYSGPAVEPAHLSTWERLVGVVQPSKATAASPKARPAEVQLGVLVLPPDVHADITAANVVV